MLGSVSQSLGEPEPLYSLPACHGPDTPQKSWSASPLVIDRIKAAWGALALLLEGRQRVENKQFGKLWGRLAVSQAVGRIFAAVSCAVRVGWGALLSANDAVAQTRTTNAVLRAFVCLVELF